MQLSVLLSASFAATASAAIPTINLGYFSYQRANDFVAWSPFTPTTTQELTDVCNEQGPAFGTPTWTNIRSASTLASKPICRNPFNITDVVTNTIYYDYELACVDDDIDWNFDPVVTAVVDRATSKEVKTCVRAPTGNDGFVMRTDCGGFRSVLSYAYVCSS